MFGGSSLSFSQNFFILFDDVNSFFDKWSMLEEGWEESEPVFLGFRRIFVVTTEGSGDFTDLRTATFVLTNKREEQ